MKNFPHNTSLPHADMVCMYEINKDSYYYRILNTWQGCEFKTFLRLQSGADIVELAAAVTDKQTLLREMRSFTLQPLTDMHLYAVNGEPAGTNTLRLFILIAMATLLIACVNYINMVTARSASRHGEISLKKIMGAKKRQLLMQLITEAFVLFVIAVVFAVVLNMLFMPQFNQISGKELLEVWFDPDMWRIYALMLFLLVGFAGVYPAWLLASFKPAKDLQERKRIKPLLRSALIIFQFVISVALIVVTVGMTSQLKYMRNKDLGFNKEQVLVCKMYNISENFETVKLELMRNTAVRDVTNANQNIMSARSMTYLLWEGKTNESNLSVHQIRVDTSFVNVMQIPLAEGQNFTSLALRQAIPNETAIKAMGLHDPVGKWIEIPEWDDEKGVIVGVAKDYHFTDLYEKITPIILYYERPGFYYSQLFVRVGAGEEQQAITALEKLWKQFNPSYTFDYHFLDEEFDVTYKSEIRTNRLFGIFSCIAIFISCLSLFGLITYKKKKKTKEIGIRKVYGASIKNIIEMLSKEYLILVGIAMLIAFPVAYFWADTMLQDYAYRINISGWMFALAAGVTIVLTLLTVGIQALRAAVADPVKSISSSE
jgi:putative ABC transport system permease protein